jgi:hypothetical protein
VSLLISSAVYCQDKPSFVSLKGGVSIPVKPYSGKDLETGCFTTVGFNVGVEGAWYFLPYLGIGGQFGLNLHPVDVSTLGYEKVQDDPFLQDVTIRSDPYQLITSAAGIYAQWSFWKILSLHGKLLGGMMWAKTPYQLYKPTYFLTGPEYFEITPSKDRNLAGIIGAGLQVEASPCIAFRLEGEYAYSKMVFGFRTATTTRFEYKTITYVNTTLALIILL